MRARFLSCGVAWLTICAGVALGDEPRLPESSQVASCPTVLPVAEGERSIVVPTIDPHVTAPPGTAPFVEIPRDDIPDGRVPHVASRPIPSGHEAAMSLLKEKLTERDRLQREIAALRESTQTPEQVLVRVKMVEINLTKLRKRGLDLAVLDGGNAENIDVNAWLGAQAGAHVVDRDSAILKVCEALEKQNLGRVLAEPAVVTTSGRPASICIGGEIPIPQAGEAGGVTLQKYGTQLDVMANTLGDNRVRLDIRPRVSEIDADHSIVVAGQQVPALRVRECDTNIELEFGKSAVLSGLVQERTESFASANGVKDEVQEIALVIVVTPEIVR